MRDDHRAVSGVTTHEKAAANLAPGLRESLVSTGVTRTGVGIEDEANRFGRKFLDRGRRLFTPLSQTRIHEQHAVVSELYGDIASCACEHIDVSLHRQYFDIADFFSYCVPGWRRHWTSHAVLVFRIRGLRTAQRRFGRHSTFRGKLSQLRVRARQVVRNVSLLLIRNLIRD